MELLLRLLVSLCQTSGQCSHTNRKDLESPLLDQSHCSIHSVATARCAPRYNYLIRSAYACAVVLASRLGSVRPKQCAVLLTAHIAPLSNCRENPKNLGYMYVYIYIYIYIQGVTGGTDQTSGGCSLC